HAVHVVVAIDADFPPLADGAEQQVGGLGDVGQGTRWVKAGERGVEEPAGRGRIGGGAGEEGGGDDRRDARPAGRPGGRGRRGADGRRCQTFSTRATDHPLPVPYLELMYTTAARATEQAACPRGRQESSTPHSRRPPKTGRVPQTRRSGYSFRGRDHPTFARV